MVGLLIRLLSPFVLVACSGGGGGDSAAVSVDHRPRFTLNLPLPSRLSTMMGKSDKSYPLRTRLVGRLLQSEEVLVTDVLDAIFENHLQQTTNFEEAHPFFRDVAAVNRELEKYLVSGSGARLHDPSLLKESFEERLERARAASIKLNDRATSIQNIFRDLKVESYSGTVLNAALYKKSLGPTDESGRIAVIIFHANGMMPGILVPEQSSYHLYGVDPIVHGRALTDYGLTNRLASDLEYPIRVISLDDFLMIEAIKSTLDLSPSEKQGLITASLQKLLPYQIPINELEAKITTWSGVEYERFLQQPWKKKQVTESGGFHPADGLAATPFDFSERRSSYSDVMPRSFSFELSRDMKIPAGTAAFRFDTPEVFELTDYWTVVLREDAAAYRVSTDNGELTSARSFTAKRSERNDQIFSFLRNFLAHPLPGLQVDIASQSSLVNFAGPEHGYTAANYWGKAALTLVGPFGDQITVSGLLQTNPDIRRPPDPVTHVRPEPVSEELTLRIANLTRGIFVTGMRANLSRWIHHETIQVVELPYLVGVEFRNPKNFVVASGWFAQSEATQNLLDFLRRTDWSMEDVIVTSTKDIYDPMRPVQHTLIRWRSNESNDPKKPGTSIDLILQESDVIRGQWKDPVFKVGGLEELATPPPKAH